MMPSASISTPAAPAATEQPAIDAWPSPTWRGWGLRPVGSASRRPATLGTSMRGAGRPRPERPDDRPPEDGHQRLRLSGMGAAVLPAGGPRRGAPPLLRLPARDGRAEQHVLSAAEPVRRRRLAGGDAE